MRDGISSEHHQSAAPARPGLWTRFFGGQGFWRWFRKSVVNSGRLTTLLALIGLLAIRLEDPAPLRLLTYKVFDIYQQIRPRAVPADSPVIIADIDEKSLAEIGQWTWPRTVFADLVNTLTEAGAKVIVFDVVFSEPDRTSAPLLADSLNAIDDDMRARLRQLPSNDAIFAEAIKASGRVVLGQPPVTDTMTFQDRPLTSFAVRTINSDETIEPATLVESHPGILRPLPELDRAAAGRGVFSVSRDFLDGIVRIVPMVLSSNGDLYPSLTLETLRVSIGGRTIGMNVNGATRSIEQIFVRPPRSRDAVMITTDAHAQIFVYFAPHSAHENKYISITDILNGRIPRERLENKLVLVGTSAQGLRDVRSTPLDPVLPAGVEVHANILENILYNDQLTRPALALGFELMAAAFVGLMMIILTPMVGARIGVLTFLVFAGGLVGWSWYAFTDLHQLYDPVFPVLVALMFYSFLTYAGYLNEEGQRKQVRSAFGQYLSPALVEKLANDPSQLKLGGEDREMTFLFSDIRGFTAMSEIFDAQGLTKLINRLLTPLTTAILKNNGTIDKYMGDCVMAFWNAPLPVADHGHDACRAALAMVEEVNMVNAALEEEAAREGRPHRPVAVGIGLNSGIACVGNMGSDQRFDYSVLGDNVNLASRLEGQSKTYGVTIVLGENTAALSSGFALLELDLIKVKGKQKAVRIYTVVGDESTTRASWFPDLKQTHDAALAAYRAQDWGGAEAKIAECRNRIAGKGGLTEGLNGFYDVLQERITAFRAEPPPVDWDGVYVAESK